jgi:hypothetical protein
MLMRCTARAVSTGTKLAGQPAGHLISPLKPLACQRLSLRNVALPPMERPLTGSHVALCRAFEPPVARSACARNRESAFCNEYEFRDWGGGGWWIWRLGVEMHWCFNARYPCSTGLAQSPTLQSSPRPEDALFTVLGCLLEGSRSPLAAIPTPARTMDGGMADMDRGEGAGPSSSRSRNREGG